MAPLSRPVHLIGMGAFAVLYVVRASLLFGVSRPCSASRCPAPPTAPRSCVAIASVSFIGVGMMTAVLPLISPRRARSSASSRRGSCSSSRRLLLGRRASRLDARSPRSRRRPTRCAGSATRSSTATASGRSGATSAADRDRDRLDPARPRRLRGGERYAKRHGKLKRSGSGSGSVARASSAGSPSSFSTVTKRSFSSTTTRCSAPSWPASARTASRLAHVLVLGHRQPEPLPAVDPASTRTRSRRRRRRAEASWRSRAPARSPRGRGSRSRPGAGRGSSRRISLSDSRRTLPPLRMHLQPSPSRAVTAPSSSSLRR